MKHEKLGVFYLLPSSNQYNNEFDLQKKIICDLTKIKWRLGKSVLIACNNKLQAKEIDEALWKFDVDSFLPHSLFGEHSFHKIPIIIYWAQCCYDYKPRDILINLIDKEMNFFINFNSIIDFVSSNNILKELARIRYKSYKKTGFQLQIINNWNIHKNKDHERKI